jgi:hypothetical protein
MSSETLGLSDPERPLVDLRSLKETLGDLRYLVSQIEDHIDRKDSQGVRMYLGVLAHQSNRLAIASVVWKNDIRWAERNGRAAELLVNNRPRLNELLDEAARQQAERKANHE